MAKLEVIDLKKKYSKVEALRGVSFSLDEGKVLAIIGPSGNGKSTLLKCLNFLEQPTSGTIKLDSQIVLSEKTKPTKSQLCVLQERIGLVFQNYNLFPQYTVFDNVKLAAEIVNKRRIKQKKQPLFDTNIDEIIDNLLKKLALFDKKDSYPFELSGGESQRVAIARAIILKPEILCFDEPTSALDPKLTKDVIKLINELKSLTKITIIIVTHDMKFAKAIADEVIVLGEGQIKQQGSVEDIFNNSTNEFVKNFLNIS